MNASSEPQLDEEPVQPEAPPRRRWFRVLPYVITAAALYYVLRAAPWGSLWGALRLVDPYWFAAALAGFAVNLVVQTYRWSICLEDRTRVPFRRLFSLILSSFFFNNFGLGFLGGDVYRTARIAREHGLTRSAFSVLLARATNIGGAAVLPAAFAFLAWDIFRREPAFMLVFVLSLLTWPVTILFLALPLYRNRLRSVLARWRWTKAARAVEMSVFNPANLWLLFVSSLLFQLVAIVVHVFLARALAIPLGLKEFAIIAPCSLLLTSLPISVNGVGVREACYVVGFAFFDVGQAEALAFSITTYSGHFLYSIIGGLMLLGERWGTAGDKRHGDAQTRRRGDAQSRRRGEREETRP